MSIQPKYEDVVARLDAALGREAALREELKSLSAVRNKNRVLAETVKEVEFIAVSLQQRLTVAEQRVDRLNSLTNYELIAIARTAALNSVHRYNYMPSLPDEAYAWEPHYWVIEAMRAALKPAAEGEGSARKDLRELQEAVNSAGVALKLKAGIEIVKVPGILQAQLNEALSREKFYKERISGLVGLLDDVIRNPMTKVH